MPNWLDACIDLSHWNNAGDPIDWSRVDPAIVLVFAKATQGGKRDPQHANNRAGCYATGRMFIPYDFLDGSSRDAQVAAFRPYLVKGLPFMLDWEGRAAQTASPVDAEYIGKQLEVVAGRPPLGYWGIAGSTPARPTPAMAAWPRFVPRYPVADAGSLTDLSANVLTRMAADDELATAAFWQYTSAGKVGGIVGAVDRSVWNGTLGELRAWYDGAAS